MESVLQTPYQVGQAIRSGRVHQNLSQIWLAQRCNISQPSLSKIEQGVTSVTLAQFTTLCALLNLEVFMRRVDRKDSALVLNIDPDAKPGESDIGGVTMEQLIGLCRRLDTKVVVRERGEKSFFNYFTDEQQHPSAAFKEDHSKSGDISPPNKSKPEW